MRGSAERTGEEEIIREIRERTSQLLSGEVVHEKVEPKVGANDAFIVEAIARGFLINTKLVLVEIRTDFYIDETTQKKVPRTWLTLYTIDEKIEKMICIGTVEIKPQITVEDGINLIEQIKISFSSYEF